MISFLKTLFLEVSEIVLRKKVIRALRPSLRCLRVVQEVNELQSEREFIQDKFPHCFKKNHYNPFFICPIMKT